MSHPLTLRLRACARRRLERSGPPSSGDRFHRHPALEELLYVVAGRVQQWVGREQRVLGPGDLAHVPMNEVHGSYNVFAEPVTFLAVLSPAVFEGPALIDVSGEEPWRSLEPAPGG